MSDFRSYCDESNTRVDRIELSEEESRHLISANRARSGDEVIAFNGEGVEWKCNIEVANKRKTILRPYKFEIRKRPPYRLNLAQAAPKGKGLESIVRRSVELGVHTLYPIITERTELKIITERQANKDAKLRASAIEGAKQSGNPFLPQIEAAQSLHSFFDGGLGFDLMIVGSLRKGALPIDEIISAYRSKGENTPPSNVIWLIGPEGDFSDKELEKAIECGFKPATLGANVMRCETAALYALSVTSHELQKAWRE